jgi:hypothetical protein
MLRKFRYNLTWCLEVFSLGFQVLLTFYLFSSILLAGVGTLLLVGVLFGWIPLTIAGLIMGIIGVLCWIVRGKSFLRHMHLLKCQGKLIRIIDCSLLGFKNSDNSVEVFLDLTELTNEINAKKLFAQRARTLLNRKLVLSEAVSLLQQLGSYDE